MTKAATEDLERSRRPVETSATSVAASLALGLLALVSIASVALMAGSPLSPPVAWATLVVTALVIVSVARGALLSPPGGIALAAILASIVICYFVIDTTYDGQEYHFDAVYSLVHGWNPYREAYGGVIAPGATALPWPGHYPLASWLLISIAAVVEGGIEPAKFTLAIPIVIVPLAWFRPLRLMGFSMPSAAILACCMAASPIALGQFASRLNDGVLGSLAMAFAGFAIDALQSRFRLPLIGALACFALAIDIKFNAFAIFGALAAAWCVSELVQEGFRPAIRLAAQLFGATIFAVAVLGFHPYITNTIEHGQPFWPIIGAPELEINTALEPVGMHGHSMLSKFARSWMSSADTAGEEIKVPFSITKEELQSYSGADTQTGGFGPWMSSAIVFVAVILAGVAARGLRQRNARPLLLFAGAAFASVLVTKYNWWPRFVPQFWLAAILVAIVGTLDERRWVKAAGWACMAVLAINSAILAAALARYMGPKSLDIWQEVAEARAAPGGYCANFARAHARIDILRASGATVFPLTFPLPARCEGDKTLTSAWGFNDTEAQSCPCSSVTHDPTGRWVVPADTTVQDVSDLHLRSPNPGR